MSIEKIKVVVFGENGAKILINPKPSEYEHLNFKVNPSLTQVYGVPPENWRLFKGEIIPKQGMPATPPNADSVESFRNLKKGVEDQLAALKKESDKFYSMIINIAGKTGDLDEILKKDYVDNNNKFRKLWAAVMALSVTLLCVCAYVYRG